MPENSTVTTEYTFSASREQVFKAWSDEGALKTWYGPKGMSISKSVLDFRIDGTYDYEMLFPNGNKMAGKWVFTEITPHEKLVFLDHANGMVMQCSLIFAEKDGQTQFTLTAQLHQGSPEQKQLFEKNSGRMQQGWRSAFEKLQDYLDSL